ncbi:MAG: ATP-binding protein [Methanoculleus sp.]
MKIRTQLIISTVVFALVLLVIAVSAVTTDQRLDHLNQQEQIASTLAQGANDLSYLSTEYLLYREDLQRTRWESVYTSFSSDLSKLDPQTTEQQALVINIQGNQNRLKEIFDSVAQVYATSPGSPGPAMEPVLQVLWSRMAVQTQGMGADATQLARIIHQERAQLELASSLLIFALMGTFAAYLFTSYFLFYRRTLVAIESLQKGARIIGSGNLDYAIVETTDDEISDLSHSFNRMAADLKGVTASKADLEREAAERKQAEEALQRQTEDLARVNRDLESAHQETNLYLDILTHDIGNTENVSNLYTELLIDSLPGNGEAAGYTKKLQRSVRKSIEILGTVSKIRRIHSGPPLLRPTELDAIIREETGHYPNSSIRYEGAPYLVRADDLLPEVLVNLIGNAVKHGGPDAAITIRTEEENGFVRVTVEDTGSGVPDDQKQAIFHRYEQKKRGVGEGLGLYLVQILVERYGGRVWVDDRVPGHPECGAAFRFTLEKT